MSFISDNITYDDLDFQSSSHLIKAVMEKKKISMRQLNLCSGISVSTISRIISGKQKVTLAHIKALSECLEIPIEHFLKLHGISLVNPPSDELRIVHAIREMLSGYHINLATVCEEIQKSLLQYEDYVRIEEGKQMVAKNFPSKIESINASGHVIDSLNQLYMEFMQESTALDRQILIGSGLLYFILTMDVIPDYIFPFGYIDDMIALSIVTRRLSELKISSGESENTPCINSDI